MDLREPRLPSGTLAAALDIAPDELRGLLNARHPNAALRIGPEHGAGTRSAKWTPLECSRVKVLAVLRPLLGPVERRRVYELLSDEDILAAKDGRPRFVCLFRASAAMADDDWTPEVGPELQMEVRQSRPTEDWSEAHILALPAVLRPFLARLDRGVDSELPDSESE